MKIRLLRTIPVGIARKHNMVKGKVVEAEWNQNYQRGGVRWWTQIEDKRVGIMKHEAEVVEQE